MPKVAHIYVDLASTPTLLQMVDMIRQDDKEEKKCKAKGWKD